MINKKSAFTLAEVILAMAVIGIIAIFGIKAVLYNHNTGVRYIYSNVYHNLDMALYNAMNYTTLKNPFPETEIIEGVEVPYGGTVDPEEDPDEAAAGVQQLRVTRLCKMLTEYINASSENCSAPPVDDSGDLAGKAPHFISNNNVWFYISQRYPEHTDEQNEHSFFIVYADINGDRRPNSMRYVPEKPEDFQKAENEGGESAQEGAEGAEEEEEEDLGKAVDPDIFAFAALDIGRVCPLGPPEVDMKYMRTRIKYYEERDGVIYEKYTSASRPYNISKAQAWGYYLGDVDDNVIIDENPLSFNGYVREHISEDSNIYRIGDAPKPEEGAEGEGKGGKFIDLSVGDGVSLRSGSVSEGGLDCFAASDAECEVVIDKYVY